MSNMHIVTPIWNGWITQNDYNAGWVAAEVMSSEIQVSDRRLSADAPSPAEV